MKYPLFIAWILPTALLCAVPAGGAEPEQPQGLSVSPPEFSLRGVLGRQQLLVTAQWATGREADLTREATYESGDTSIAEVTSTGLVLPRKDGTTAIKVVSRNFSGMAQVTVSNLGMPATVDFRTDVIASLSRAGCSQGACHGSPQGKQGFRLSLRGFDPDLDLQSLTREAAARRTNILEPEASLILLKGSGRVPHQGGVRFHADDPSYQTLRAWIAAGCRDSQKPRQLVSLEVLPSKRTLHPSSPKQQVLALAHFDDGTTVDVSSQAVFSTTLDPAYSVSADGLVEFHGTAAASVLVRYLQQVRSTQLTYVQDDPAYVFRGPEPTGVIDQAVFAKQRALQLQPAPLATDADFLRRIYLDVIGTLPTPDEAREFLDSKDPGKREQLIDRLLQRDEFADFWALKWADVMRGNRTTISQRGVHSLHRYLVDNFSADRPWDQVAREIITSRGNTLHKPAANFYRISPTPEDAAEGFGQLFLGVRLQCAKCHNHPFEALTQTDYYGLAAYFARVKIKGKQFAMDDEIVYLDRQGEVQHPLTRKNLEPVAFGKLAGKLLPEEDRRIHLANWLTDSENRLFARSTVNRIWYHLLGKGIVEPVDDFRDTNPPSNPELLDALATEFVRGGYRFKPVIRSILQSRTYQLAAYSPEKQSPGACNPARYFTQATVRMLTAEQAVDAMSSAVGLPEVFPGYPAGTRAIQLPEGAVENHLLMAFSRPIRDAACDCAREEDPSLSEVLHLLNNSDLVEKIKSPQSRLGLLVAEKKSNDEIVEGVYLATLSRRPTPAERKLVQDHIATIGDQTAALQDLQHALLVSNEFLLRH